ncbi:MAG: UDP-N-acetylglucosamine 2-epimerase [Alphaproteobacteria bacterium]|nr:UDP-N-acetylglucosamine 2-epimerase [Alphaproteobacteria bacterium]
MRTAKRKIGIVTTSRADYGIYRPVLSVLAASGMDYFLYVTGTHLSAAHGMTVGAIEADGHPVAARVSVDLAADDPAGIASRMGETLEKFSAVYAHTPPDILLVLGDRYEMLAAALAAVPFNIPIAHIHGGEISEGAIDDAFRHAITKISHLHFPATQLSAQRIAQMGENESRIFLAGAPSLDNISGLTLPDRTALHEKFDIWPDRDFLLVTYHPVTREYADTKTHIKNLLTALEGTDFGLVFTQANADTFGNIVNEHIAAFVRDNSARAIMTGTMGTVGYFGAMRHARAVVGNSSSGIIEAASFKTPVVNIGNRQKGREQSRNTVNCGNGAEDIAAAIRQACGDSFRAGLAALENIYGQGRAAGIICDALATVDLDMLKTKGFVTRVAA